MVAFEVKISLLWESNRLVANYWHTLSHYFSELKHKPAFPFYIHFGLSSFTAQICFYWTWLRVAWQLFYKKEEQVTLRRAHVFNKGFFLIVLCCFCLRSVSCVSNVASFIGLSIIGPSVFSNVHAVIRIYCVIGLSLSSKQGVESNSTPKISFYVQDFQFLTDNCIVLV